MKKEQECSCLKILDVAVGHGMLEQVGKGLHGFVLPVGIRFFLGSAPAEIVFQAELCALAAVFIVQLLFGILLAAGFRARNSVNKFTFGLIIQQGLTGSKAQPKRQSRNGRRVASDINFVPEFVKNRLTVAVFQHLSIAICEISINFYLHFCKVLVFRGPAHMGLPIRHVTTSLAVKSKSRPDGRQKKSTHVSMQGR